MSEPGEEELKAVGAEPEAVKASGSEPASGSELESAGEPVQPVDAMLAIPVDSVTVRSRLVAAGLRAARSRLFPAVLSFLWPGLGQLRTRRRVWAAIFAIPVVLAVVWLVIQLSNGLDYFGASFLDDSFALTVVVGGVLLCGWRIASMVHAYAVAGPRKLPGRFDAGVLAVLLIVVLLVHGTAIQLAWAAYNMDRDIASNQLIPDEPTPVPTGQLTAGPSPTVAWTPPASGSATPAPTASPPPVPSHRLTILLTGMDFTAGRNHSMNDSILVVSVDTQTDKVVILSLPRDTANYDFYWGGSAGINTKINNFANLVANGQIHAPDPAATALANEVGFLVGVKIDYYAIVDIDGFGTIVDAAHGVCIGIPKTINDPSTGTYIPAGNRCLDGATTLKYVRSRHTDSDYARAGRQQQVLIALARQLTSAGGVGRLAGVMNAAGKVVQTNFPLKTARNYVTLARNIKADAISQCVLGPPYNYHPDPSLTKGAWTTRLKMYKVAQVSTYLFGTDSRFYGMEGITPAPCGK